MKRRMTVLACAIALVACGSDPATVPDTTTPSTETTEAPPSSGVSTAMTSLGTVLVDPDGMTLYVFTVDSPGESECYDSCATLWPPVPGDTPIGAGLDASLFGTTTRTDGSTQLTVNGQPLYLYIVDTAPGQVTGQDVDNVWFVVGPDGVMIGGPPSTGSDNTTPGDVDYGYGDGY